MNRFVEESMLPTLKLDISAGDISAAAERIADWMEETGGLRAK